MILLVANAGASTLKLAWIETGSRGPRCLHRVRQEWPPDGADAEEALRGALAGFDARPDAFGHRVVHGGQEFVDPTLLDDSVVDRLEALIPLAPLHNGPAVAIIRASRRLYPHSPAVAVFDTAFHANRPAASMRYALPERITEPFGIRRFGFHGIAHASLLNALALAECRPAAELSAVSLQLGAGCSACAIDRGRSVETSMGFTPLEGLIMGTRCGDIDPAIVLRLMRAGFDADRIETELTRHSGLEALCGLSDMRRILAAADQGRAEALSAVDAFCRRISMTAGAYFTLLEGRGALIFGGGIGTHAPEIRARVAARLAAWNIALDPALNHAGQPGAIGVPGSRPVYVFDTDEEPVIAVQAAAALAEGSAGAC